MVEFGRPVDEPSSIVLNFLKPDEKVFWEPEQRALQQSNLDGTNVQIRVFVASSER